MSAQPAKRGGVHGRIAMRLYRYSPIHRSGFQNLIFDVVDARNAPFWTVI
jgi:hypothetical protein